MTVQRCFWHNTKAALLAASLISMMPAMASADCKDPEQQLPQDFTIKAGLQEPFNLPAAMVRVAVGEPTIADVAVVDVRTLLLQGRKAGETSLLVWTQCDPKTPQRVMIRVLSDLSAAQQLAQADTPETLAELPSQVQADIRFVEVSRSKLIEVGTRLQMRSGSGRSNFFGAPTSGGTAAPGAAVPGAGGSFPLDPNAFNIVWGGNSSRFLSAINLLESNGYAYTLSRPSLVALSGQTANFLAGGEVPVPVPQGQGGSVGIEYKEFGVRLTISPTVLSPQQILLRVAPEVSELDFTNAITIQGSIVPALRIRRTDTSISLADGESFIISGLVSRNTMSNVDKMPGLGNIPVLGAFFRSSRFESEDRELLMIVTPRLVRPIAADARLPVMPAEAWRRYSPGAGSLFWQGVVPPYTERPIEAGR
ncbi:MAG: type II and III secretion system protein family protein [Moraxellaceae bacterium]|nr:type II and III secretion system protein family protein [Moraxellaceae bacterium]